MSETATQDATPAKAKRETVYTTVQMLDGRTVDFPGKTRLLKNSFITPEGAVSIRLDFVNGETRTFPLRADMLPQYAAHGAEQKYGDEISGVVDLDDAVEAIDQLAARLEKGEWNTKRDASGLAGASILLKAIVTVTGKPVEKIREYLAGKTGAEKLALRQSPRYADEVKRLEALKASKRKAVDVAAIDAEIDAI